MLKNINGIIDNCEIMSILILLISSIGCSGAIGAGDGPSAEAAANPAAMYDTVTAKGQFVQSNGFSYDIEDLDIAFEETMECLNYKDIPYDIYIVLKEPYSAFPCVPLPNGCGGLFDLDNGEPVITVSADLVRLKHEYVHYMLYYSTGDPDSKHETEYFYSCI